MKYPILIFRKLGIMSQKTASAAVVTRDNMYNKRGDTQLCMLGNVHGLVVAPDCFSK